MFLHWMKHVCMHDCLLLVSIWFLVSWILTLHITKLQSEILWLTLVGGICNSLVRVFFCCLSLVIGTPLKWFNAFLENLHLFSELFANQNSVKQTIKQTNRLMCCPKVLSSQWGMEQSCYRARCLWSPWHWRKFCIQKCWTGLNR